MLCKMKDSDGQMTLMLCNAVCLLIVLKAFVASTSRAPSVLSSLNASVDGCRAPEAAIMSGCRSVSIALAIIRLGTSPMPIGRTPGFLSKGISLLASKCFGFIFSVHRRLPTAAKALHSCFDSDLYELQNLLHP